MGKDHVMREYIVKRILISIIILYIIATLNFILFQANPMIPDPSTAFIESNMERDQIEMLLELYGLKEPLHIRYIVYIRNMFTFQFGLTFVDRRPVVEEMKPRLINTVILLGASLMLRIPIGMAIGIFAASKRKTKTDAAIITSSLFTHGIPAFFVQLLFILFFSYYLSLWLGFGWPAARMTSVPPPTNPLAYVADVAWHMSLPLFALLVKGFGGMALYTRNLLVDALSQDYVLTARAKGLSERAVLYKHALRGTLPPIATMITMDIPDIFTGAMITEFIFTWPGMGTWFLYSLRFPDYPVLQAIMFISSLLMVVMNLIADLIYGVLDPRIKVGQRR